MVIDSLVPRLWQPVHSDALLKGFVVKVGGCLGLVRGGVYFQYFFFFLVLHLNTLQQRNWKSCLKVGHSSAVSIETSSQRAVRFTSTGGAFARRDGLQPVVPVDPGPPQYPGKEGTERGHSSASPRHDQGQCSGVSSCPLEESGGSATSPRTGDNATSCGVAAPRPTLLPQQ